MKFTYLSAALLLSFITPTSTFASCRNYPKRPGVDIVEVENGVKIFSTAMATVPIDDAELYIDALEEAKVEAKVGISSFMSENVSEACKRDRKKIKKLRVTNENKSVDLEKVKTVLCSVSTQTQALLKGTVNVGECYTPGKFVMVTVGIKPQTISNAKRLSNNLRGTADLTSDGSSSNSGGFTNIDGYSNTDRFNDF
ncbi:MULTISPECIES: hypothetical protein [unclassified Prochlorococcus]|uniref:hypothetical protein n=1 Tax=unclassified Prochlorococcus TaxID=2627481 RepID=UPI000533ACBB|nr:MULTISPECIES: hypothetical protein [unclassified Prochlorococcus]KGG14960.1 hypothetical protein EV06_2028 [Prochlorococcus sp. MIT 0602]KGG15605.1 hypothetical protein EV07_1570 [Prochlorococcus sp. MIT 0603]